MRDDSLPRSCQVYNGVGIFLDNRMRCRLCTAENPWYRDHPLGDCYVCGADFSRKRCGFDSARAQQSEAARNERIRKGLEYVTTDGLSPASGRIPQALIRERNVSRETVSTPLRSSTEPSSLSSTSAQYSPAPIDEVVSPLSLQIQGAKAAKSVHIAQGDKPLSIYDEFMQNRPVVRPRSSSAQNLIPSVSAGPVSIAPSAQPSHHDYRQYTLVNPDDYYPKLRNSKGRVADGLFSTEIHPLLRPSFDMGRSSLRASRMRCRPTQQSSSTQDAAAKQQPASADTLSHSRSNCVDKAKRPRVPGNPLHQERFPGAPGKVPLYQGSSVRRGSGPVHQAVASRSLPHLQSHASSEVGGDRYRHGEGEAATAQTQREWNMRCCRRGLACVRSRKGWICAACGCTTCFGWNSGSVA